MPTITAGDFRKGMIFEMDGKPMVVVDFQHVKPGKGAAFVRTKYKNVITGTIREESFNPTAKFEQGAVERKDAEYSYNDGDLYYFMDPETFDMTPLNKDVLGDAFQFVKENTMCKLVSYKGSVFTVEVPNFVELEVTETEPGVKGDTATNVTKKATSRQGVSRSRPTILLAQRAQHGQNIQYECHRFAPPIFPRPEQRHLRCGFRCSGTFHHKEEQGILRQGREQQRPARRLARYRGLSGA